MAEKLDRIVVTTSTIIYCKKCHQPSAIYEPMVKLGLGEDYYHSGCVSDDDTKIDTETKVRELFVTDDLNVKSEGR